MTFRRRRRLMITKWIIEKSELIANAICDVRLILIDILIREIGESLKYFYWAKTPYTFRRTGWLKNSPHDQRSMYLGWCGYVGRQTGFIFDLPVDPFCATSNIHPFLSNSIQNLLTNLNRTFLPLLNFLGTAYLTPTD